MSKRVEVPAVPVPAEEGAGVQNPVGTPPGGGSWTWNGIKWVPVAEPGAIEK